MEKRFVSNTITVGSGPPPQRTPCNVYSFFQEEARRSLVLPDLPGFIVSRDDGPGRLHIDDPRISREHATVTRHEHYVEISATSPKNPIEVNGERVARVQLRPGERFTIRRITFTMHTEAMCNAVDALTWIAGSSDPSADTVHRLLTMPRTDHAVFRGTRRAPLALLAETQHRAIALPGSGYTEAALIDGVEGVPRLDHVLLRVMGGRVFLEGRRRRKGRLVRLHLSDGNLERLAAQRTALSIGFDELGAPDETLRRGNYRVFVVPSLHERLNANAFERDYTIDKTFVHRDLPWRAYQLHPDFLRALSVCPWSGELPMLSVILAHCNAVWRTEREPTLIDASRTTLENYLDEFGLTKQRIRELRPDPRAVPTPRSAHL